MLNSGTNGIIVNAAATDDVILRSLDINGGNTTTACPYWRAERHQGPQRALGA